MPDLKQSIAVDAPFEPKRGRPSATQSAAIERVIRDAAAQSFLSAGYERTSMEAVAAQAGVPKTTLYKRYPDKRSLLRAVLSDRISAWGEVDHPLTSGESLEQHLKRIAAKILHRATTPEVQAFWALASAAWSSSEEIGGRHEAIGYEKIMTQLERDIRELGPASGIEARDPKKVATALMAMLGGWIEFVAPTSKAPEIDAQEFAESCVDLLMRGSAAW